MSKPVYIIGRAGDVVLYDDTVSRRHASLEVAADQLILRDLDSRNGTYLIRDKALLPFSSGAVQPDQVFAFGECVRSVAQLIAAIRELTGDEVINESLADTGNRLDSTQLGFSVPPRPRLSHGDIVEMLERIESAVAAGQSRADACAAVGITEQRYERWCKEHGSSALERSAEYADLRRENERLRKLVEELTAERDTLRAALMHYDTEPPRPAAAAGSFTLVSDKKS
ncbi:MAG: FHA domain-containing protein [Gammaproteobacteria bacterium]